MVLEAVALCHVGRVRQNNEDNFYLQGKVRQNLALQYAEESYKGSVNQGLFAVADGMGGEADGELASLVTVQSLRACALEDVYETAMESIGEANEMLCDEMLQNGGKRMGSTLAALYVDGDRAIACNVGDSRIYLMRDGHLTQQSVDHTIVQQMVDMGAITKEQARTHKRRHVLSQNIGIFPEELVIEPYFTEPISLLPGDIYLLCSDGLTDMVTDEEIREVLWEDMIKVPSKTFEQQAKQLIDLALQHGGKDNVTVMLVKIEL